MTSDRSRQARDQIDAAAHNLTLANAYANHVRLDGAPQISARYRQQATEALIAALALLNPANDTHEPTPPTEPVGAKLERAA